MKNFILLLCLVVNLNVCFAEKDQMTFAVMGNSISTYENYLPSGYAVYYATSRGFTKDLQVGDTWWMRLSRLTGMSFLCNSSWSGSRVASDPSQAVKAAFTSDDRVNSVGRAGVPDAIVIAGGTNDWSKGIVPLGEYSTTVFNDSLTFRGAYTMLLHKLRSRYPKIKLFCCSIFPRSAAITSANSAGWTQNDANLSIEHIAKQFGGYYIDCTGVPFSSDWTATTIDKLHPTALGHKMLAECMAESLLKQGAISDTLKKSTEVDETEKLLDLSFDKNGIVNNGTFKTTVGQCGGVASIYNKKLDTYFGCTKMANSDYYYALYDADDKLGQAMNNSATWEALVRLDNLSEPSGSGNIVKFFTNQEDGGWSLFNTPNYISFNYLTQAGAYSILKSEIGDSTMIPGRFYHFVVTLDRPSHVMRFFVNGKCVATGTRVATDLRFPNCGTTRREKGLWIGLGGDTSSSAVGGTAQNGAASTFVFARIYNGALTEKSAKALYNDEVKKFTEPTLETADFDDLILDTKFTEEGAVNIARSQIGVVEKQGNVKTNYNSELKRYEAKFSGSTTQFFKYNMGTEPYIMNKMGDAYSVEVLCKTESALPSSSIRPVSFLDGTGTALHMNAKGNIAYGTITFGLNASSAFQKFTWTWVGENSLSDKYSHYVISYNRKEGTSKLFINGEEKASRSLTFREAPYFEWAPAEWLAIGGTPKNAYDDAISTGSYPFKGSISNVRVWSKALNANEAKALYSAETKCAYEFTLPANGYIALCLPFDYTIPEGLTAFIVTGQTDNSVDILGVGKKDMVVKYGTPIILSGTAKQNYTLSALGQTNEDPAYIDTTGNILLGSFGAKVIVKDNYYVGNSGKGMMHNTNTRSLSPFGCWLESNSTKTLKSFNISYIDAIKTPVIDSRNPELNQYFNLEGQPVENPTRGIYILNGKKVFVK